MVLETGVAAAVLLAGLLHASWNTLVKTGDDPTTTMLLVMAAGGLPWLPALVLLPPPAPASWPYLGASVVIHLGYFGFLLAAYRHGDLSQVYPIARGGAPALVAGGAWVLAAEALTLPEMAGLAVVCLGIMSLAWRRGGLAGDGLGVAFALLTALTISAYIVADGMGVRRAGGAFSYIAWYFVLDALSAVCLGLWLRRGRLLRALRQNAGRGIVAGLLSTSSYGIAMWAMSLGPMAHVVALRETSVLMAAVIGTRLLGEPFGPRRVAAAAAVAAGAVLLQVASLR